MDRPDEAKAWLARSIALDPDDGQTLYNAACTYAQLGDTEAAFDALHRWLPTSGVEKKQWLAEDNDFDPIRDDARFIKLLADAKVTYPS